MYTYLLFDLTCYGIWWCKLGKFDCLSCFLCLSIHSSKTLIKNYRIGASILKVYSPMKRLNHYLIKSDKNYHCYYEKSLTVVLYILYMSAYRMNFHFKNSQKFWWILIVYRKMCKFQVRTATRSRVILVFSVNIIISLCATIGEFLVVA